MKLYAVVLLFTLAFLLATSTAQVTQVISPDLFETMLNNRNRQFYSYDAFVKAADSFNGFGTTGDLIMRKRELAAFFGQTSHETSGYRFIEEINKDNVYCDEPGPCAHGKKYYGRGPIQLTHNYNYKNAGEAIKQDLINNPELVATNAIISFKTAIWFWMTKQDNKPSSHDVILGRWIPSDVDRAANRVPGYGVITNIINGGVECGKGPNTSSDDRISYYKKYCDLFGLDNGPNLECRDQRPFNA